MSKAPLPRVQRHVDALRAAGLDATAFLTALMGIRDDSGLNNDQRKALLRMVAHESFLWYCEALRGGPIDRKVIAEEAKKLGEEPAILKRSPGDRSALLLQRVMERVGPS